MVTEKSLTHKDCNDATIISLKTRLYKLDKEKTFVFATVKLGV